MYAEAQDGQAAAGREVVGASRSKGPMTVNCFTLDFCEGA
jgi:hypothetical protein